MLFYLHRVCFAWRCLAVGKYRPIVTFQNICTHWGNHGVELQELGVWGGGRRCHAPHLSRSSEPQRCRTAPESCWTETRGRSSTACPAATKGRRWLAFEIAAGYTRELQARLQTVTKKQFSLRFAEMLQLLPDVRHGKTCGEATLTHGVWIFMLYLLKY